MGVQLLAAAIAWKSLRIIRFVPGAREGGDGGQASAMSWQASWAFGQNRSSRTSQKTRRFLCHHCLRSRIAVLLEWGEGACIAKPTRPPSGGRAPWDRKHCATRVGSATSRGDSFRSTAPRVARPFRAWCTRIRIGRWWRCESRSN